MKKIQIFIAFSCCLLFAASWSAAVDHKQLLNSIEYLDLSSNADQVTFKLNGSYSPKAFTLKGERPRMVFDFQDVQITGNIKNSMQTNGPIIKQIRVGLHKGEPPKTRVVFDLATTKEIFVDQHFNDTTSTLTVTLSTLEFPSTDSTQAPEHGQGVKVEKVLPPAAPVPAKNMLQAETVPSSTSTQEKITSPHNQNSSPDSVQAANAPLLRDVSFDNSSNKGEMVLFKLNGFYPPIVHGVEEGLPRAVCDFQNTALAESVKSIEKANGKYVKSIRVGKHKDPDKIRVVLDLEPNNNYDLQQVFFREDNLFVIIVNTIASAPLKQ